MSRIVEVTREGFGSRGKKSIGGVLFGFALVAAAVVAIFWNEGRAVKRYQDLKEGAGTVVSIPANTVDATFEGKLIHTTGEAETTAPLSDELFGITESAIRLSRAVEMYQWVETVETETKNKTGGSTETTKSYSYSKKWEDKVVDASQFKAKEYENPKSFPYSSQSTFAKDVTLGAFSLPEFLVRKIGGSEPYVLPSLDRAAPEIQEKAKLTETFVYLGRSPDSPEIGDVRISFSIVRPGPVSIVAQQAGNSFVTYSTKNGTTLDLLESGVIPAEEMFSRAHSRNKLLTWAIRAGLFVLLGIAFNLILAPLVVFASILPFLGRIAQTGTMLISFLLAGITWTLSVGIAWIFHRPILGIIILAGTLLFAIWIVMRLRSARESGSSPSDPPPPPFETPPPLQ